MDFKELVSPSLTDLFIRELQNMILSGKLKKGEKLPPEREMAASMKVSTAVVNGGIRRLAEKGFLRIAPRKGVFVADYIRDGNMATLEAILEYGKEYYQEDILSSLVDFRRTYEVKVTSEACANRAEEHLANLADLLTKMEREPGYEALSELAYEFHHEIAIASGGAIHALLIATFKPGYISSYRTMLRLSSNAAECLRFFQALYNAIREKDSEAAERLVLDSIERWDLAYRAHFIGGQKYNNQA